MQLIYPTNIVTVKYLAATTMLQYNLATTATLVYSNINITTFVTNTSGHSSVQYMQMAEDYAK